MFRNARITALEARVEKAEHDLSAHRVVAMALTTTQNAESREILLQFIAATRQIWIDADCPLGQIKALDDLERLISGMVNLAEEHGLD